MDQSEETFAAIMNRFEYKNKGYGCDLYLKPEHHGNFKGSDVNIGLIEVQNYMVESAATNMKAERLDPKELPIFKNIEDWYNTLNFSAHIQKQSFRSDQGPTKSGKPYKHA